MPTLETPWGQAERVSDVGGGILCIETPSHGGYFVPPSLNILIPEAWRKATFSQHGMDGWYEEDGDWCLVALTFPQQFPPETATAAKRAFQWFSKLSSLTA